MMICRCKRKEHDESPKNCCKFTKSTTGGETMTAGPFWMKWMAPSTEEQEQAAVEEEKQRLKKYHLSVSVL